MSPPDAIQVDVIVGLDARGFLLGPAMALAINKPFVPIRSPVKKLSKAPKNQQQMSFSIQFKCAPNVYYTSVGFITMEIYDNV